MHELHIYAETAYYQLTVYLCATAYYTNYIILYYYTTLYCCTILYYYTILTAYFCTKYLQNAMKKLFSEGQKAGMDLDWEGSSPRVGTGIWTSSTQKSGLT